MDSTSTSIDNTETLEPDFPSSSSNTDSDNSAEDNLDYLINILEKDSSKKITLCKLCHSCVIPSRKMYASE